MAFWYVIRQGIHTAIRKGEIRNGLRQMDPEAEFEVIPMEIVEPGSGRREYFKKANWQKLAQDQTDLFNQKLKPVLTQQQPAKLAYFGFAPIPLIIHLGQLVSEIKDVMIFQHHHDWKDWLWPITEQIIHLPEIIEPDFELSRSDRDGFVNFLVSTSYKIHPDTLPESKIRAIGQVALSAKDHDPDWFLHFAQLHWFKQKFIKSLRKVAENYPNLTQIQLFASIPCGLAFAIGQEISPTVFPPIQTFQYYANEKVKYQSAILLNPAARLGLKSKMKSI